MRSRKPEDDTRWAFLDLQSASTIFANVGAREWQSTGILSIQTVPKMTTHSLRSITSSQNVSRVKPNALGIWVALTRLRCHGRRNMLHVEAGSGQPWKAYGRDVRQIETMG